MSESLNSRIKHAWNAFKSRDPTSDKSINYQDLGYSSYRRQDRVHFHITNERSIIASVYNRIALDVAEISILHVKTDQNGRYESLVNDGLNYCLNDEANLDQTGKAFIQDLVMSMFDEGVVAAVPIDTTLNPSISGAFDIQSIRTGKILQWYPNHIKVSVYNERVGIRQEIVVPKNTVAIIENPFYSVMNEPNSTLKRLVRKLAILDAIDEQSGSGKLDIIIQLPYTIKTEARRTQAENRRKDIEMQLSNSKYGIAYTDGTERVTQLNRAAENNLMSQVQYLTSTLYSQLGLTEDVFNGKADEATMLNYTQRTIVPIVSSIVDEFKRKFLTKTARSQNHSIMYFRDIFKLVPTNDIAEIADKFTRNEIMSSNEFRSIMGLKPSKDPSADELRNKNLNESAASLDSKKEDSTKINKENEKGELLNE